MFVEMEVVLVEDLEGNSFFYVFSLGKLCIMLYVVG